MLENKSNNLGYFPNKEEIDMIIEHRKTNQNISRLLDMLEQERESRIKAEKRSDFTTIVSIVLGAVSVILGFIAFIWEWYIELQTNQKQDRYYKIL